MRLLLAANNQATRQRNHKKLPSTSFNWVQAATDMHPACPNKKPNHLQNSLLRRTQFWVRKSFSKPASLKRASLVLLGHRQLRSWSGLCHLTWRCCAMSCMNCICCVIIVCSITLARASTLTCSLLRQLFVAWSVLLSWAHISPSRGTLCCIVSCWMLWNIGGTIHAGMKAVMYWMFHITCKDCDVVFGVMHLTCPSTTLVYDSDLPNDAVTFSPRYISRNQYCFWSIKERWVALTSNTLGWHQ